MITDNLVIGWVGNYRRINKHFDVAQKYCNDYGHQLNVAGPPKTKLHQPHEQMPQFYRDADLILSTSSEEAHPLAVYESLACETPVAMLDVGDCSLEEVSGITYYNYLDSDTINECIETIMENRESLGKAGRRSILDKWQWKHWTPKYLDMFQTVAGKIKRIKLVITVDKPEWAWDLISRSLVKKLMATGHFKLIHIAYTRGVDWSTTLHIKKLDPGGYDVILNHCWQLYNHYNYGNFSHTKNIPCANGAAYCAEGWSDKFTDIASEAGAVTTVSKVIYHDLGKRLDKKRLYHCSRGVDIDKFKP